MIENIDKIWDIYEKSFPEEERRSLEDLKRTLSFQGMAKIKNIRYGENIVGFIIYWEIDDFLYIEHFAVEERYRNMGIGRTALNSFLEDKNKPTLIEVELPDNPTAVSRIAFYKSMGFCYSERDYWQPPYRKGENSLRLGVMYLNCDDFDKDYRYFVKRLHLFVYGVDS